MLVLSRVSDDALEFVDVFVHIFVEKRRVCKKEECSCVMCYGKFLARLRVESREAEAESLLMFVCTFRRGVHLGSGDFVYVFVHIC